MRKNNFLSNKENRINFKNILNRNELTVLVIALMLVTAGYLDYLGKIKAEKTSSLDIIVESEQLVSEEEIAKIGDATLVSAEIEENIIETSNNTQDDERKKEVKDDSYFISSKLERANIYSQTIENYQKIMENSNISEEQKAIASQEISKINQIQNAIMISENLLLAKGFDKCIIFVNDQSISVIIGKDEISQEELAQIQNILSRELNASIENIHISLK